MTPVAGIGLAPLGTMIENQLEIRYPALQKMIVVGACVMGGVITCVICFLFLPSPISYVGLVSLGIDLMLGYFFWRYFGSFVIRADGKGISRTTLLHTQSVRWEEIDAMKMQRVGGTGGAIFTLTLEDTHGNILLGFRRGFATRAEQEKLLEFIRARMNELEPIT